MKELHALHDKIITRGFGRATEAEIQLSKDEIDTPDLILPDDLAADLTALHRAINQVIPAGFDYLASLGVPDDRPMLELMADGNPAGDIEGSRFDREQPLIPQLAALDWDSVRMEAEDTAALLDESFTVSETMQKPLRTTKQVQREFGEHMKEFVRRVRVDAKRFHVLWHSGEVVLEESCDEVERVRALVALTLHHDAEIITVVAGGKPLPVARIDGLNKEVQSKLVDYLEILIDDEMTGFDEPADGSAHDITDAIDVESSVVELDPPTKP